MRSLLFLTLIFVVPLVSSYSYRKAVTFKKKNEWINLGTITTTGESNVRAMLITYSDIVTTRRPDLNLIAFSLEDWELASKAKDCAEFRDHDHYTLQILLNDTWVKANRILFPESTMQIIASNCHSPYATNLQGRPIDLEITNCTYELPEEEPIVEESAKKPAVPVDEDANLMKNFKLYAYSEREVKITKFEIPNIMCTVILATGLIIAAVISTKAFCSTVHFILILSILLRITMHILLLLELSSEFFTTIIALLDICSQFGFFVSCISMIFNYPPSSPKLTVIADILAAVLYYLLGSFKTFNWLIGLRGALGGLLVVCFMLGNNNKTRTSSKGCGVAMGLIFLVWLTFVESLLLKCAGSESILLDRIELVTDYPLCSNKFQWGVKYDYLFQAFIMGVTAFISGFTAKSS